MYNITRGQLVTLWVFGLLIWLWSVATALTYSYEASGEDFLVWFVPFVLIFYTIGWRQKNSSKSFVQNVWGVVRRHWKIIILAALFAFSGIQVFQYQRQSEIQVEKEKLAVAQNAYQACLDKVVKVEAPVLRRHLWGGPGYEAGDPYYINDNPYLVAWSDANRPHFDDSTGHWEWSFIAWLIKNNPDICKEFNLGLIEYFLEVSGEKIGKDYF